MWQSSGALQHFVAWSVRAGSLQIRKIGPTNEVTRTALVILISDLSGLFSVYTLSSVSLCTRPTYLTHQTRGKELPFLMNRPATNLGLTVANLSLR